MVQIVICSTCETVYDGRGSSTEDFTNHCSVGMSTIAFLECGSCTPRPSDCIGIGLPFGEASQYRTPEARSVRDIKSHSCISASALGWFSLVLVVGLFLFGLVWFGLAWFGLVWFGLVVGCFWGRGGVKPWTIM